MHGVSNREVALITGSLGRAPGQRPMESVLLDPFAARGCRFGAIPGLIQVPNIDPPGTTPGLVGSPQLE